MTRQRWLLILGVVVLIGGAWWFFGRHKENVSTDFIATFDQAVKRPSNDAFSVIDATVNGVTKRAIFTQPAPGTRFTYHVVVPDDAWFETSLSLKPEAWTMNGDGVLFMVGVSDGKGHFEEILNLPFDPIKNPTDRSWHDIKLDLSNYAGQTVDIICNTFSGTPGHDDRTGDLAL